MKQLLLTTSIIFFFVFSSFSQINKLWHFNSGSTGIDNVRRITTDSLGNVYIVGYFRGTVDFDPSPTSTYNLSVPVGNNQPDAFIQKLDASGNLLWAKSFGSSGNYFDAGYDVVVDDTGNVYMAGSYTNDIQFTTTGTVWQGGSTAWSRPYLVKLDSSGNVKWGYGWKLIGEQSFAQRSLALDDWGKIHFVGYFKGTADFDPTSNSTQIHTSLAEDDCFMIRISASGTIEKVRIIGGNALDINYEVRVKAGSVYMIGFFLGSVNFSTTSVPDIVSTMSGVGDAFITKMDTGYNHGWVRAYASGAQPISFEISNSEKIYTTGNFLGTRDFDPSSATQNLISSGNQDIYIQVLDTAGNFISAYSLGGSGEDRPYDISISPNENVAIVGRFNNTVDFNPKSGIYNMTSAGDNDAYVLKLDSACTFIQAVQFGGTGYDNFFAIKFINSNDFYVGGYFENSMDVNPDPLVTENITSSGQEDLITIKLSSCSFSYNTFAHNACGSYTLPSGTATYTTSGTYNDTIPSATGCDSILTINLTILPDLNPTITQTINGLEASATGSGFTYAWMNCQTGLIIQNATSQTFMPTYNGSFAVIVDDGICVDTSACFNINNVSISENNLLGSITLYPNPTTGLLLVESMLHIEKMEVFDVMGRVVLSSGEANVIDLSFLTAGVYLVKIETEKGVTVRRVVKN